MHYQHARCCEAQVEKAFEAIDEGVAQLNPPDHANAGVIFPRSVATRKKTILDWEVAATVDFVQTMISHGGTEGVCFSDLIATYLLCARLAKTSSKQELRYQRYICAVVACMHAHMIIRCDAVKLDEGGEKDGEVRLTHSLLSDESLSWSHGSGMMADTWLQWCFERSTTAQDVPSLPRSPVFVRTLSQLSSGADIA